MKTKIVRICIFLLITIATVVPAGLSSEKTITKPWVDTKLIIPGNYEQGCFNISWPSYDKLVRYRFPVKITEICNESHTDITVNITITNNGPARLCCVPPLRPKLAQGGSRTYQKVIPTFLAGDTMTIKSPVLFGWGFPYINITITVDDCPLVTQTARVFGHFIAIP